MPQAYTLLMLFAAEALVSRAHISSKSFREWVGYLKLKGMISCQREMALVPLLLALSQKASFHSSSKRKVNSARGSRCAV